jgi:hypothetical protein
LAFDVLLAANHVGEYRWQCFTFQLRCCDLHVKLACGIVFEVESDIVLLFPTSVGELTQKNRLHLTTKFS